MPTARLDMMKNLCGMRIHARLDFRRSLEFGYPPREETAGRVSDRLCL